MRGLRTLGTLFFTLFMFDAGCGSGSSGGTQPSGDGGTTSDEDASVPVQSKDARARDRAGDAAPVGLTWNAAESGTSKGLSVVIWADDAFFAVGDGGTVLRSPDGETWSALASGISDDLRSLTWTGKRLVAVAADGKILTSDKGTSWAEQGTNLQKRMRQAAWTGKVLSAVGLKGYTGVSNDGITWSMRQNMDLFTMIPTSSVWIGDRLIWGGYDDQPEVTSNAGLAFATKDGVAFTSLSPGYACNSIFGLAWNGDAPIAGLTTEYNGMLLAVGRNGAMFEMNYGRWNSGKWGEGYISTMDVNAVVWTGSEAVAVGEGGLVLRSTTGHYTSWKQASVSKGADFTSLAWNGDRLVAVGSTGTIITSP